MVGVVYKDMYFLLSNSGRKNDIFIYYLLYSNNMKSEAYETLKKALSGSFEKIELFGDGMKVDNSYLSRHDLGDLGVKGNDQGFGVFGDIFTLAATAKQNYTDIKDKIEGRQRKTDYPLANSRRFDPYQQKSETPKDYEDPYKKLGVV
jgi:hypothetical protein